MLNAMAYDFPKISGDLLSREYRGEDFLSQGLLDRTHQSAYSGVWGHSFAGTATQIATTFPNRRKPTGVPSG